MPSTINATPTSSGLISSADASGVLELQSGGVTKATISSSGLAIGQYNPTSSLVSSGTAVASTSGTSITFTSIPAYVKRVTVMYQSISTNGASAPQIQIGSGSVLTSGYTGAINSSAEDTNFTSAFLINSNSFTSSGVLFGQLTIANLTGNSWVASGVSTRTDIARGFTIAGTATLSGALDRIVLSTANGTDTFDAGSINILFE